MASLLRWCASNIERIKTEGKMPPSDLAKEELRRFSSRVMGRWPDGEYFVDSPRGNDIAGRN